MTTILNETEWSIAEREQEGDDCSAGLSWVILMIGRIILAVVLCALYALSYAIWTGMIPNWMIAGMLSLGATGAVIYAWRNPK